MYSIPIIEKLGGRDAVADMLKRPGRGSRQAVSKHALNMWVARDSIPGFAVVQLVELANKRGIQIGPSDFKRRGRSRRLGKKKSKQEQLT